MSRSAEEAEDLVAEVLCDYAILRAQILALCDLLVKKKVLAHGDVDEFLARYTAQRRPRSQVTTTFLKDRLTRMGFSERYVQDAVFQFEATHPRAEKKTPPQRRRDR